jgi:hypothetical protein
MQMILNKANEKKMLVSGHPTDPNFNPRPYKFFLFFKKKKKKFQAREKK